MGAEPFILVGKPSAIGGLFINGAEANHLVRVLRARPGFKIIGFDGCGKGWQAEVLSVSKSAVECRILETLPEEPASRLRLHVGVGVVKGQRMDWAVEKTSETGAEVFIPMLTERSVVTPGDNKLERWRGIALASAKQSRRLRIMKIAEPTRLSELIDSISASTIPNLRDKRDNSESPRVWALHNGPGSEPLVDLYRTIQFPCSLTLLIGPEGGYSDEEIRLFEKFQIPFAAMGRRPLRTETAAAVAIGTLTNLSARNSN